MVVAIRNLDGHLLVECLLIGLGILNECRGLYVLNGDSLLRTRLMHGKRGGMAVEGGLLRKWVGLGLWEV